VRTQVELGKALNRSWRTVATYVSQGMPKGKAGYDVEKCREWIAANVRDNKEQKAEKRIRSDSSENWEAVKLEFDAKRAALKFEKESGSLVSREDVEHEFSEFCLRLKDRMLQAPEEFEMRFPAETRLENKREFENFINILLREVSQWELLAK